ncbi:MAG TPA: hypothetical protein VG733_03260 [Chthoniobacteraceae bacterium]|nr:hypothetical protein [Chthoniobacteraceae bacterium]
MEVQIAALCDSAEDYGGKLCILGTFDTILARSFPFHHPKCSVALRLLLRHDDEGAHNFKIAIVDEDGKPAFPPVDLGPPVQVRMPDNEVSFTHNLVFHFQQVGFERAGFYSIDITVNGRALAAIPFRIVQYHPPAP